MQAHTHTCVHTHKHTHTCVHTHRYTWASWMFCPESFGVYFLRVEDICSAVQLPTLCCIIWTPYLYLVCYLHFDFVVWLPISLQVLCSFGQVQSRMCPACAWLHFCSVCLVLHWCIWRLGLWAYLDMHAREWAFKQWWGNNLYPPCFLLAYYKYVRLTWLTEVSSILAERLKTIWSRP